MIYYVVYILQSGKPWYLMQSRNYGYQYTFCKSRRGNIRIYMHKRSAIAMAKKLAARPYLPKAKIKRIKI